MSARQKRCEEAVEKLKFFGGLHSVQSQFFIHYIDLRVPKNVAKNVEVLIFIKPNLICSKLCRTKIIPLPRLNDATEFFITPTGCSSPLEGLHTYKLLKTFGLSSPLGGLHPFTLWKHSSSLRAVAPPLRAYKPTFSKSTHQAYGAIALPLGESGRAIATVVAHREPWGVKN